MYKTVFYYNECNITTRNWHEVVDAAGDEI